MFQKGINTETLQPCIMMYGIEVTLEQIQDYKVLPGDPIDMIYDYLVEHGATVSRVDFEKDCMGFEANNNFHTGLMYV